MLRSACEGHCIVCWLTRDLLDATDKGLAAAYTYNGLTNTPDHLCPDHED